MKIPGDNNIIEIIKKESTKAPKKTGTKEQVSVSSVSDEGMDKSEKIARGEGERVNISEKAKVIQRAVDLVKMSPDMRIEKVSKLKKEIEEGSYFVPSEKIADRIVKQTIEEVVNPR